LAKQDHFLSFQKEKSSFTIFCLPGKMMMATPENNPVDTHG